MTKARARKIQLLKDLEAGRITLADLKRDGEFSVWMNLDGKAFRNAATGEVLTPEQMAERKDKDKSKRKEWISVTLEL